MVSKISNNNYTTCTVYRKDVYILIFVPRVEFIFERNDNCVLFIRHSFDYQNASARRQCPRDSSVLSNVVYTIRLLF